MQHGVFKCENTIEHYICKLCDFKTDLQVTLNDHIRNFCKNDHSDTKLTYSKINNYTCRNCNYTTNSLLVLLAHQTNCTSKRFYNLLGQILSHDLALENQEEYRCSQCLFRTETRGNLKNHITKFHIISTLLKRKRKAALNLHENCKRIHLYKCGKCGYKAKTKINVNLHMKLKHSFENQVHYECSSCSFKTPYKWDFELHQHNEKTKYRCCQCNYTSKLEDQLKRHAKLKHIQCSQCPFRTPYNRSLERHMIKYHKIEWFKCDKCNYKANIKAHLDHHIKFRHPSENQVLYECNQCSFRTPYKWQFERHQHRDSEKNTSLQCDQSYNTTGAEDPFKLYAKLHIQCSECSFKTPYDRTLEEHIINYHPKAIEWFLCDKCNFKTKLQSLLNQHTKLAHLSEKNQLIKLIDLPENQVQYECTECSFKTFSKWYFQRHRHEDTEESTTFYCDQCDYTTTVEHRFKQHTELKHISCNECAFKTPYHSSLGRHVVTYHTDLNDVRWFRCDKCDYKAILEMYLTNHIKIKHS